VIAFAAPRSRVVLRRALAITLEAALAFGTILLLLYLSKRHTVLGVWIDAAAPAVGGVVGALLAILIGTKPIPQLQVTWDRDAFRYRVSGEERQVLWPEYKGYRFTWGFPTKLKLLRATGRPIVVDFFAFDEEQRAALLTELSLRAGKALPN